MKKLLKIKNPKISVVLIARNSENTISDCIKSILRNDMDFELIIIDNNSTDSTKIIIKRFHEIDKRVKYFLEKNISRGSARNKGIIESKGDIILMTDSDCVVENNWIKSMIKPIIKENEKIVIGGEIPRIHNYWTVNYQKNIEKNHFKRINKDYIADIDTKNIAFYSGFIKGLMFDDNMRNCEDLELLARIGKTRMRFIEDSFVIHNHKSKILDVIKQHFDRGFWTYQTYLKHQKISMNMNQLNSINLNCFLNYVYQLLFTVEIKEKFYRLITEGSWRLGIFYSFIIKKTIHY